MSIDQIRTIVQGPVGGFASAIAGSLVFRWLVKKWSRWIPVKVGEKGRLELLNEHKTTLRTAKALTIAAVGIVILCLKMGWLKHHDWRVLGLLCSLAAVVPIGCIVAVNVTRGAGAIKEGMVAFAISERTPAGLLIGFITLCLVGGLVSAVNFFLCH